ncbi:MAG: hypothetical protein S4CHLAM37_04500 [Chlamydiia bacterium]|nr:hypothetical protein [Chlamydiia bacterium]
MDAIAEKVDIYPHKNLVDSLFFIPFFPTLRGFGLI